MDGEKYVDKGVVVIILALPLLPDEKDKGVTFLENQHACHSAITCDKTKNKESNLTA
jgi:hypothetical protein